MPLKGLTPGISIASFPSPIPPKSGGSNVNSVQRGTTSFATADTIVNVPISAVNVAKSIALVTFRVTSGTSGNIGNTVWVKADITNPTTLQINRAAGSIAIAIEWQVIEFTGMKSIQSGTFTMTAASQTVAISKVNPGKSFIYFSYTDNDGAGIDLLGVTSNINANGDQLLFNQNGTASKTIKWYVVEFP